MSNTDKQVRACAPGGRGSTGARLALVVALGIALAACGNSDEAVTQEPGSTPAPEAASGDPKVSAAGASAAAEGSMAGMGTDELRSAARTAYAENRLYAPAGDNAVEYFLALRASSPGDASASSALTDLLPMTVIAIEQSLVREDFEESQRLIGLLERVDGSHPALSRLRQSAETGQREMVARVAREEVSAEEQARRQAELERQRAAEQERQQQEAARELAEQQAAEEEEARLAAAEELRQQEEAERRAAEQRAAEQRRAAAAAQSRPTAADLRPLSMPAPEYPSSALRTRQAGEVEVELTIGTDGSVTGARVIRADPARVFDRAALAAVERWRFQPVSEPVTARRTIAFSPD